jgi:hypothetical protein
MISTQSDPIFEATGLENPYGGIPGTKQAELKGQQEVAFYAEKYVKWTLMSRYGIIHLKVRQGVWDRTLNCDLRSSNLAITSLSAWGIISSRSKPSY